MMLLGKSIRPTTKASQKDFPLRRDEADLVDAGDIEHISPDMANSSAIR